MWKACSPTCKSLVVTPCVIIDDDNEERTVRRCNRTHGARSIYQLSGTWEIDSQAANENREASKLGICIRHLNYDKATLHPPQKYSKAVYTTEQCKIRRHCCLFCNKVKCYFTRGKLCMLHAWNVCGHNIQVPCRGLYDCPAITSHEALSYNSPDNSYTRFVCTECFIKHGGHLYIQQGSGSKRPAICVDRGLHCRDTTIENTR